MHYQSDYVKHIYKQRPNEHARSTKMTGKIKPAENRLFLSDVYGCSEYGENEQPRKMSPDGNFLRGLS